MYPAAQSAPPSVNRTATGETEYTTSGKAGGWKVNSIDVRKADNGGFIVRCDHEREATGGKSDRSPTFKTETLAFKDIGEVCSYLQTAFGSGPAKPAAPDNAPVGGGEPDEDDNYAA